MKHITFYFEIFAKRFMRQCPMMLTLNTKETAVATIVTLRDFNVMSRNVLLPKLLIFDLFSELNLDSFKVPCIELYHSRGII